MKIYLALGSNRGHRAANLEAALAALPGCGVHVQQASRLVLTPPQGASGRRWYRNGAVEAETDLPPRVLLSRLLQLERKFRRHRPGSPGRKTPRTLDLDLILYGRQRLHQPGLIVPHPRLAQRRFVLAPLAELAPHLRPPGQSKTVRQMLARLKPSARRPRG